MSERRQRATPPRRPSQPDELFPAPPPGSADELAELREVLLGPERERLRAIEQQLGSIEPKAEDVGRILPEAVRLRTSKDGELARSLAPTIEGAIQTSVRRNPKVLADAIFPVIGPAIRASIRNTLAAMLEGFNRALEQSLSPQSIAWRIEAKRTQRSFAEVVLLKTLVYRVEQVLLIHRETGLLLHQLAAPAVTAQDPELVSGMLTAIQSFMADSFASDDAESLRRVAYGDLTLFVAPGPHALVAAVVRGTPQNAYREVLERAAERVHQELADELAGFSGDVEPFATSEPHLESCLTQQKRTAEGRPSRRLPIAGGLAAFVGVVLLTVWMVGRVDRANRWTGLRDALAAEPGLVLLSAERKGEDLVLDGLRDPQARDPLELVAAAGFDPERVRGRWESYRASDAGLVLARATRALGAPEGVTMAIEDGRLVVTGRASHDWIARARGAAGRLTGFELLERDLVDTDLAALQAGATALAETAVAFEHGTDAFTGRTSNILELERGFAGICAAAERADRIVRVTLRGHTAAGEPPDLARRRAEAVQRRLELLRNGSVLFESSSGDPAESDGPTVTIEVALIEVGLAR